jgi:hypothetical protein
VALRAKEATQFHSWSNANVEYSKVLNSTVKIFEKKSAALGKKECVVFKLGKSQGRVGRHET